jgi:tripartite-type tricarboxylate transporter receptor subunit TctC
MTLSREDAMTAHWMRFIRTAATLVVALGAASQAAVAQTYPSQDIRFVCAFPAGSGADVIVRYFAEKVRQIAKRTVIVENKVGAAGNIAATYTARAKPDGYTVHVHAGSAVAANMNLFKNPPIDAAKDLQIVATINKQPFMVMVPANSPHKTLAELTAAMKQKGTKASYAYGSPPALASAELYKARAGLQAVGIPYRTAMQSLPQMYSGEIDFQFFDSTQGTVQIRGGKLRGLAITSAKRVAGVDLPPMAEAANIPGFDIAPTWGVFLPAGAPQPVVAKLEAWFGEITKLDVTKQYLARTFASSFPGDSKALAAFLPKEIKKWEELARLANIQPR